MSLALWSPFPTYNHHTRLFLWAWKSRLLVYLINFTSVMQNSAEMENDHWNLPYSKKSLFQWGPILLVCSLIVLEIVSLHLQGVDKRTEKPYNVKRKSSSGSLIMFGVIYICQRCWINRVVISCWSANILLSLSLSVKIILWLLVLLLIQFIHIWPRELRDCHISLFFGGHDQCTSDSESPMPVSKGQI